MAGRQAKPNTLNYATRGVFLPRYGFQLRLVDPHAGGDTKIRLAFPQDPNRGAVYGKRRRSYFMPRYIKCSVLCGLEPDADPMFSSALRTRVRRNDGLKQRPKRRY
ncbi:hypothetical protein J6590_034773 [Homalodisca vitripennis]|nr:hypothetical protein J6590_034773 [Homalodisca vitripennis]